MTKEEILQALESLQKLIAAGINNVAATNDSRDAEDEDLQRRFFDMQVAASFRAVESHQRWMAHVVFFEGHMARQTETLERIAAALEQRS